MRLRAKALAGLAAVAGVVAFPSSGAAQPVQQFGVPAANGVAFGPNGHTAFVVTPGPPPAVVIFHGRLSGAGAGLHWSRVKSLALPAGTDPVDAALDDDGYLRITRRDGGVLVTSPNADDTAVRVLRTISTPGGAERPTGTVDGFNAQILTDFGPDIGPGSLWYGPGFGSELRLPDADEPNSGDVLPDTSRPPRAEAVRVKKRIPSLIVVIDAQNNQLLSVSDRAVPALVGATPGPPGASGLRPPRDVAVSPLNYNKRFSGRGNHPILVPVPALGNVFVLRDGRWRALSINAFGAPQGVAAGCRSIAVSDFHNGVVTFFNFAQPKGTVCEDMVNVGAGGARATRPRFLVKAYGNFTARASLRFQGLARSKARKLRLRAGRVASAKLKFSRRGRARIRRALRRRRMEGTLTLRLKDRAGNRYTVRRRIRARRG